MDDAKPGFIAPVPRLQRKEPPSSNEAAHNTITSSEPGATGTDVSPQDTPVAHSGDASHEPTAQPIQPIQPIQAPMHNPSPAGVYNAPNWGVAPDFPFSLEVIKDGVSAQLIELTGKTHFTMGRSVDADIPMEHPSVSRLHAVIQFQKQNQAYLYDVGSTHGTVVNKKPIVPRKYFPLKNGDIIKFGQSTRMYVFNEPEREEPEAQDIIPRKSQPAIQTEVTWGMQEDATPYDSDEGDDGDDEENSGQDFDYEGKGPKKNPLNADDLDSDDDDDDFYDRTGKKSKKQLEKLKKETKKEDAPQVETVETLEKKLVELDEKRKQLKDSLPTMMQNFSSKSSADALDDYMMSLSTKLAVEQHHKINKEIRALDEEEKKLQKLLQIARPRVELFAKKPKLESTEKDKIPAQSQAKAVIIDEPKMQPRNAPILKQKLNEPSKLEQAKSTYIPDATNLGKKEPDFAHQNAPREENESDSAAHEKMEHSANSEPTKAADLEFEPPTKKQNVNPKPPQPQVQKKPKYEPNWSIVQQQEDYDYEIAKKLAKQSGDGKSHLNEKYGY